MWNLYHVLHYVVCRAFAAGWLAVYRFLFVMRCLAKVRGSDVILLVKIPSFFFLLAPAAAAFFTLLLLLLLPPAVAFVERGLA